MSMKSLPSGPRYQPLFFIQTEVEHAQGYTLTVTGTLLLSSFLLGLFLLAWENRGEQGVQTSRCLFCIVSKWVICWLPHWCLCHVLILLCLECSRLPWMGDWGVVAGNAFDVRSNNPAWSNSDNTLSDNSEVPMTSRLKRCRAPVSFLVSLKS